MSVDIDWKTLTEGPDGAALAESIRAFVHERFQHVSLPRLIRSVKCHGFDFGTVVPQIVLKDICDPLPDFYENDDEDNDDDDDAGLDAARETSPQTARETDRGPEPGGRSRGVERARQQATLDALSRTNSPSLPRAPATPGILGGTSNLGYFHLPLAAGLSGTNTPLAAVAGARYPGHPANASMASQHHHSESFSSISPPPSASPPSGPTSRDNSSYFDQRHTSAVTSDMDGTHTPPNDADHERSPEDLQVVFHATYAGDVKLSLTAEVFLDYPMPSFVGIPLKLNITGLTFNGVGILAYIKRKAHVCFLAPDDAEALVGGEAILDSAGSGGEGTAASTTAPKTTTKFGALLEDIRIESEMGQTDGGRQVLKNMGKIEKFVLEQVQRIFEDEFVYPSFWTFLV